MVTIVQSPPSKKHRWQITGNHIAAGWSSGSISTSSEDVTVSDASTYALVFAEAACTNSTATTCTCTYGGVSMTADVSGFPGSTTRAFMQLFYLQNPPTGIQTVTASFTGATKSYVSIAGAVYSGVTGVNAAAGAGALSVTVGGSATTDLGFVGFTNGTTLSSPSQHELYLVSDASSGAGRQFEVQDGPAGSTFSVSGTANQTPYYIQKVLLGAGGAWLTGVPPGETTPYSTHGTSTYNIPAWANFIDIIALGAGGGGGSGNGGEGGQNGTGGSPGTWATKTIQRGSTFPSGSTLTVAVGQGGTGASNAGDYTGGTGGNSTVSATGMTTVTATGGAGGPPNNGGNIAGSPAGNTTYNGVLYTGGTATAAGGGQTGNAPGGGGSGGDTGSMTYGSPGADGAVWLVARSA